MAGCSGPTDEDDTNADAAMNNNADMGSSGTNGSTNNADMSPEVDAEDMSVLKSTVQMTTTFIDLATGQPVAGVEVCVLDAVPENCAVADANGLAQMQVPADTEFALAARLENYYSALFTVPAVDEDFTLPDLIVALEAIAVNILGSIEITQDPQKGALTVAVHGEGVMPVVDPDAGEAFWYLVGAQISRSDTGTPALISYTGMSNLPPGEYRIRFEHDTSSCQTAGWPGDTPNEQRLIVRAGYLTSLFSVNCL